MVFRYAIVTGRADSDPSGMLKGALKTVKVKHQPHLPADQLPEFLKRLKAYDGDPQTQLAIELVLLTFVRTGELRGAKWSEINFDKAEWRIPAERMKMAEEHIVPLSRQALAIFRGLQEEKTRDSEFIFPNQNNAHRFMSENTMLFALYRMGYRNRLTTHGLRGTASTILNEQGFRTDIIERQLAHAERNSVRRAYNHAQYLSERREMMQWYADYLEAAASSKGNTTNSKVYSLR